MRPCAVSRISRTPSLTVRMVAVAVLTPLTALMLLAAVVIFLPNRFLVGLAIALGIGAVVRLVALGKAKPPRGRILGEHDDPELFAVIDRFPKTSVPPPR